MEGAVVWAYTTGNNVLSPATVAEGIVYFGSEDNDVYALDAETGGVVWSYMTGAMVVSSPAVANDIVYIGSYDHHVYAFRASSSEQTYFVTFKASGLPSGTSWKVTLNMETRSSTTDAIVFDVPNGVYNFSVTSLTGFEALPDSGSVTMHFADVNQEVTFKSTISGEQLLMWLTVITLVTVPTIVS